MLAMITKNGEPVTYVRGSKANVVNRAKELINKLNNKESDGIPVTLTNMYEHGVKFSFKIIHSVDELK